MSPETILRKTEFMQEQLEELKNIYKEYKKSKKISNVYIRAIERLVQLVTECAIDINNHYLSLKDSPKTTAGDSFRRLNELGLLDNKLTESMVKTVSLRNKLVHNYDKIEPTLLLGYIDQFISDYTSYVGSVKKFKF